MDIILLRTFLTNIGNGFIDKGAYQTITQAFPSANIIETSGYPLYAGHNSSKSSLYSISQATGIITQGERLSTYKERSLLHLSEYIDADLAVFPGCVLYPELLEFFSPVLSDIQDRGIPIIFLGAGGYFYDPDVKETRLTHDYLENLDDIALISRDPSCYNTFRNAFTYAASGIDNAFFIGDWYQPPSSSSEFDVHTFDKREEPKIEADREVLRALHIPFGYSMPFADLATVLKAKYNFLKDGRLEKENLLISDLLEDYLFLYSNGRVTHSDRVHACVPALVYGNKAQFYHDTPRAKLFERVVQRDISKTPVDLSPDRLAKMKQKQIEELERAASELLR